MNFFRTFRVLQYKTSVAAVTILMGFTAIAAMAAWGYAEDDKTVSTQTAVRAATSVDLADSAQTETSVAVPGDGGYVFSYFHNNGEDGLLLATSRDARHWTPVDAGKPIMAPMVGNTKLVRDPSIAQGPDGVFHMVWTVSWTDSGFGYASSKDLIHWSEQRFIPVMNYERHSRNTWAPEIFYDAPSDTFYIFWSSTIPGRFPETANSSEDTYNHRVYYTKTKDFETFTPTWLYFDPGHNVIDAFLVRQADQYLLLYKDETLHPERKTLHVASSQSPDGPFRPTGVQISDQNWVEGPAAIQLGNETAPFLIVFDCYAKHRYAGYLTNDFRTFAPVEDVEFPSDMRHGTIIRVNETVLQGLLQYGTP
ncbi:MAG: glycoside hydrolase family 43 protein [Thermoguttaceae bacterium]|nr:glycoside hydrolase family 43 protein [Thermoguttaceae bacterium]